MRLGRRPLFFLAVALIALLLLIPTPSSYRWVNVVMMCLGVFWFVMLGIEEGQAYRLPKGDAPDTPIKQPVEREERR